MAPLERVDKAYVYRQGEFLGCVTPSAERCEVLGNWCAAALEEARKVFGEGVYHVVNCPPEF